jgi:Flp pilus assembly protein TadD
MRLWWWRFRRRWRNQIWPRIRPEWPRFFDWKFWWYRFRIRGGFNQYIPELPAWGAKPWGWWAIWSKYWSRGGAWQFVLGLPAVLAVMFYAVILLSVSANTADVKTNLMEIGDQALARKDYDTARLAHTRLIRLSSFADEKKNLFGLAISLRGLSRHQEASAVLNSLAPPNVVGYPPAHLFLARTLLSAASPSELNVQTALRHLQQALIANPDDAKANELLGLLYAQQGNADLARLHLLRAEPVCKQVGLTLAELARKRGDEAECERWAQTIIKNYQPLATGSGAQNIEARLQWAQALMLLRQYPEAIEVLETGYRETGNENYTRVLGMTYADWLATISTRNPQDLSTRFKLLQQGLEVAPQNPDLHRELIRLSHLEGDLGETVRKTIKTLLAEGKTRASIHLVLGLDALQRNQADLAREHILLAADLAPNMPSVLNFKAMILCLGSQPDLNQALALMQMLLEKYPNEPRFRENRGRIYLRMQRYHEAIVDIEFALEQVPITANHHELLAEAYQKQGMTDIAETHHRAIQKMKDPFPDLIAKPKPAQR